MGTTYLVDTSAFSKYIQQFLTDEAADLMDVAVESGCIMSVISRIELLSWTTGDKIIEADIQQFINESSILEINESIILQTVRLRRHYKKLKLPDAIIAATAIVNGLTLLSTNDKDFERIGGLKYRSLSQ